MRCNIWYFIILHHITLYVMLCCVTQQYDNIIILYYVIVYCVMYDVMYDVVCDITCNVIWRYIISCHITSHIMLCYISQQYCTMVIHDVIYHFMYDVKYNIIDDIKLYNIIILWYIIFKNDTLCIILQHIIKFSVSFYNCILYDYIIQYYLI